MKFALPFAALLLTAPAAAWAAGPDFAGRWEIAGRQFGVFPSFQPVNDARLELTTSGDAYTGRLNNLRFSGVAQKDGLHLNCTTANGPCGSLVLQLSGGKLTGHGTVAGEPIDITGHRAATRPYPRGKRFDYVPARYNGTYSATEAPVLHLFAGDTVHTETLDNRGYDGHGVQRAPRGNPLNGPFYVEGAMPGDTLVVHITRLRLNRNSAFQANALFGGALTPNYHQSLPKNEGVLHEWRLDSASNTAALAARTDHLRDYKVPMDPMIGCIGVAAPRYQTIASNNLGPWGGNLDSQLVREGTTVYLPVFQPGALLYLGDTHAQQSDGELTGQALETSMDVEFSVDVIEGKSLGQTWLETPDEVAVMGVGGSVDEGLRIATTGLSQWLNDRYHLTPAETAAVLGTAMRYQVAEIVDPQINVVARISKKALAQIHP
jgi:acetamidase/formamidase